MGRTYAFLVLTKNKMFLEIRPDVLINLYNVKRMRVIEKDKWYGKLWYIILEFMNWERDEMCYDNIDDAKDAMNTMKWLLSKKFLQLTK